MNIIHVPVEPTCNTLLVRLVDASWCLRVCWTLLTICFSAFMEQQHKWVGTEVRSSALYLWLFFWRADLVLRGERYAVGRDLQWIRRWPTSPHKYPVHMLRKEPHSLRLSSVPSFRSPLSSQAAFSASPDSLSGQVGFHSSCLIRRHSSHSVNNSLPITHQQTRPLFTPVSHTNSISPRLGFLVISGECQNGRGLTWTIANTHACRAVGSSCNLSTNASCPGRRAAKGYWYFGAGCGWTGRRWVRWPDRPDVRAIFAEFCTVCFKALISISRSALLL